MALHRRGAVTQTAPGFGMEQEQVQKSLVP
jgi:hypothetical protein